MFDDAVTDVLIEGVSLGLMIPIAVHGHTSAFTEG